MGVSPQTHKYNGYSLYKYTYYTSPENSSTNPPGPSYCTHGIPKSFNSMGC